MNMAVAANKNRLNRSSRANIFSYDYWLIFSALALVIIGLVMVSSASIVVSERQFFNSYHFLLRQGIYFGIALVFSGFIVCIETAAIQRFAGMLFVFGFVLLMLVLVPGIGREVNGSTRWISLGIIGIQVSEIVKLCTIIYLADYLVRRDVEVKTQVSGFLKPMFLLSLLALLLLKEPDFGAAVVIMATALCMMFLAGARLWQFLILVGIVLLSLGWLAFSSPYRLARLTSFLNPWSNQFDSGYQLTQSLIAFGKGGWFGVGLGDSVQKLFYLPEAHTDFLFAVLAEELGLIAVLTVIMLFCLLVTRTLIIARNAYRQNQKFSAYLAYGVALWIAMQAMINIGVNAGVLPTKGLTLPLMSYGGSSIVVMTVVIALLVRIDFETKRIIIRSTGGR